MTDNILAAYQALPCCTTFLRAQKLLLLAYGTCVTEKHLLSFQLQSLSNTT